nr:hypothetical protein [Paenibacillus xylanexedens]
MDSILSQKDLNEMELIVLDFDQQYNKFIADTSSENNFQTILRAHLYIEHELEQILSKQLLYPEILSINKMRFSDKVKVVFAVGLVPLEDRNAILRIDKIRNDFAHKLNYNFSEEDLDKLIDSFSIKNRKEYKSYLKGEESASIGEKLKMALFTIWITLYEFSNISKDLAEKVEKNLDLLKKNNKK